MICDIITDQKRLKIPSALVKDSEIDILARDLADTLKYYINGIGLAAPQIGRLKKFFIVKDGDKLLTFANAKIVDSHGRTTEVEGCLSVPRGLYFVTRATTIVVEDSMHGEKTYSGFLARVIQHELDHTLGLTIVQVGREYILRR